MLACRFLTTACSGFIKMDGLASKKRYATRTRILTWLCGSNWPKFQLRITEVAPEIRTDQSSQFSSTEFIGLLKRNGIAISMDGRGCWRDNVFAERLWRSVNTKRSTPMPTAARARCDRGVARYFAFYNQKRPHTALDRLTLDEFYFNNLPALPKAA